MATRVDVGLMTPRYVIDNSDPTMVLDRWEEAGPGAGYGFNEAGDAREYARLESDKFSSLLILYSHPDRMSEIRPVVPLGFEYHRNGTDHHRDCVGWYLKAIALDRGEPGNIKEAERLFPLDRILAWDV